MVTSPCSSNCELNNGVCKGCNRTVEDIVEWSNMSEEEREERMKEISNGD